MQRLEDWGWLTGEPRGVYPLLDSVYPGGGFAAGLGARKPFGDDGAFSAIGAYSINSFWRAQTDVTLPSFASNRGRVSLTAGYLDAPDVRYYGIGQDSDKDHKTFFGYTPFEGGGGLDFDVSRYLSVGGGVNYIDVTTDSGATGPSIEERFSPADSPGLERDQFKYVNSTARAVVDWRRQLGYAGSGGVYRVQFDDFRERESDQDGKRVVRHHLLDFGSTIGSAGVYPREAYEGWEYLVEGKKALAGMPSLGLYVKNWRTAPLYRAKSVGAFPIDNTQWDPERWRPRYANSAFRSARLDDKFWAARRLQAVTDEMLNALIGVGRFGDPKSEEMLSKFLIERRSAILRRYLPAVNPIVDVRLSPSGALTFRNAAVDADVARAPKEYVVAWQRFDNATGATTNLGETRAAETNVNAPKDLPTAASTYIRAEISASGGPESWTEPAHAYFRRGAAGWTLVGFERVPGGNPPGSRGASRRTN